jgi:hypothetical protein
MDPWSTLSDFFHALTDEAEKTLDQLSEGAVEASEAFYQASEAVVEAVDQAIAPILDQVSDQVTTWWDPLEAAIAPELNRAAEALEERVIPPLDAMISEIEQWYDTVAAPLEQTLNPLVQNHPTCVGCRHYHGQTYGGNLLVCGMYPYGPETERCPDWQSAWSDLRK